MTNNKYPELEELEELIKECDWDSKATIMISCGELGTDIYEEHFMKLDKVKKAIAQVEERGYKNGVDYAENIKSKPYDLGKVVALARQEERDGIVEMLEKEKIDAIETKSSEFYITGIKNAIELIKNRK